MKKLLVFSMMVTVSGLLLSTGAVAQPVPEGAIWHRETVRRDTPLSRFTALAIWAQAATMTGDQSPAEKAIITVDYWKVIEIFQGDSSVIYTEDYIYRKKRIFTVNEAGLYCRYPHWFDIGCLDVHDPALNMSALDDYLTIDISKTPNTILHWWTPKLRFRKGAIYCVECRIKVEGKTAVQFGMDYWLNLTAGFNRFDNTCQTSNNCEAWISDWLGDTHGNFITIRWPERSGTIR